LGCVAFADLAGILMERYVPHEVRAVFDAPVAMPPSKQLGRIGLVTAPILATFSSWGIDERHHSS